MAVTTVVDGYHHFFQAVAREDLGQNWMLPDCTTVPMQSWERVVWAVAQRVLWVRALFMIDPEATREEFKKRVRAAKTAPHLIDPEVLNAAIVKFNANFETRIPLVPGKMLKLLSHKWIVSPQQLDRRHDLLYQEMFPPRGISENFHRLGGRFKLVSDSSRIGIYGKDLLYPVCEQGLYRSQMLRRILIAVKLKLKQTEDDHGVFQVHGINGGYDGQVKGKDNETDSAAIWMDAFEMPYEPRYGRGYYERLKARGLADNEISSHLYDHFTKRYFHRNPDIARRSIYFTFFRPETIMHRLIESNPVTKDNLKPLENVHVVHFHHPDNISNFMLSKENMDFLIQARRNVSIPFNQEVYEEPSWIANDSFKNVDAMDIAGFAQEARERGKRVEHMVTAYAARFYFAVYSHYFYPIETCAEQPCPPS